jgi:excisionase family DNA binding protein
MNQLYSLKDAAKVLGNISPWTLRRHLKLGTIMAVRVGKRVLLAQAEVERVASEGLPSLGTKRAA